nr:plastocyanin/azurin family copper-binding protein [Thauera sp. K11]
MFRATLAGGLLVLGLAPPLQAAEQVVEAAGYKFVPAEVRIRPGDSVVWVNREKRVSHSVLFAATGEESPRFFPDERWSRTFEQAGRFEYRCGPHPEMTGVVIVGD